MATISIDTDIYKSAEMYAKQNNVSIRELVESYLTKLLTSNNSARQRKELPKHIQEMCGILSDVEDKDDDRLNYLLEKYK